MIRVVNRVLLVVIGMALVAGGLLVVIEGVWTWTNSGFVWIPGNQWLNSFETTRWSDSLVVAISIAIGVVGLVLLVAQISPQRRRVAPYHTETTGEWLLLRRSTEGHLQRRIAAEVAGSPITARLEPKEPRWTLKVKARAAASTAPALEAAARAELARLHAPDGSRILVETTGASAVPS